MYRRVPASPRTVTRSTRKPVRTTGFWAQSNVRELADVPEPVLPKGFRFLAAEDVSVADAVKAHRDAWYPSSFTEAAFERVRRTWPYRADLHVLIEAPDGTLAATRSSGWTIRREPLTRFPQLVGT